MVEELIVEDEKVKGVITQVEQFIEQKQLSLQLVHFYVEK